MKKNANTENDVVLENKKKKVTNGRLINKILKKLKNIFSKVFVFEKSKGDMYSFKEVVIIMFFSLGLGFVACLSYVKIFSNGRDYVTLSRDLSKFVDTYYAINDNYYGEFDKNKLVDAAIEGMVGAVGDRYTSYSNVDDTNSFMQTVSGVYEGIGCTVATTLDGNIVIMGVFSGSPAEKAGLKVDDIIIKIDGEDYTAKTSTDMSNYVKNCNNSKINLTVIRDSEEMDLEVLINKIEIPYVDGEIISRDDKNIGYISISLFSSVVNSQFEKQLLKLEKEGIDGLIIDVRGNSGGYLSSVTDIINMFLKKGDVIYQLKDGSGVKIKKDTTKEKRSYPVVVLIDKGSASASEILASSIKESYGGFVVGTNSFGKGTVQQTTTLPDGSMIKYTTQNWLTPNGNWVNETGVEPTDYVELSLEYLDNPIRENDNQLEKAIELIIKK